MRPKHLRKGLRPVSLGDLRTLAPLSRLYGTDRGINPFTAPVDRYYIEHFLGKWQPDIKGTVLEVGYRYYTKKFGRDQVTRSEVLSVRRDIGTPTIIDDLTHPLRLSPSSFDCVICTQTLQYIADYKAAINTLRTILRPAGVLLATFHGISQISQFDNDMWGDYWRFTPSSAKLIFGDHFLPTELSVDTYGNVLSSIAFLTGLAADELSNEELDYVDHDYPLLIAVRAQRTQ